MMGSSSRLTTLLLIRKLEAAQLWRLDGPGYRTVMVVEFGRRVGVF